MHRLSGLVLAACAFVSWARGDEVVYSYEGDALPYEPGVGWITTSNLCDLPCEEFLGDGTFGLFYSVPNDAARYFHRIAEPGQAPPPTLWVEFHFRSNHPLGPNFYNCGGSFSFDYRSIGTWINTYGNAAVWAGGNLWVPGLPLDEFHTYRFESLDGAHYWITANGLVFVDRVGILPDNGYHTIQFGAIGGCGSDWVPNMYYEWDFIRYGTISFGERIVESDPPAGFLDPGMPQNLALDRFTVTYDSPAYAYIDDITVDVTCDTGPPCAAAPQITATKRLDNGPPDVLEVVLDRPLPPGERTTFTFTDVDPSDPANPTINTVAYTFQRGDVNADGQWNLFDFASLQNCYFVLATTNNCAAFDYDVSIFVDAADYATFAADFITDGP